MQKKKMIVGIDPANGADWGAVCCCYVDDDGNLHMAEPSEKASESIASWELLILGTFVILALTFWAWLLINYGFPA